MKKIELICVGKIKEKFYIDAINEYAKRLTRFCDFEITELKEYGDNKNAVESESSEIVAKLNGYSILLDLKGTSVSSADFAKTIDTAFTQGAKKIQIIIGGSNGVNDIVRQKADKIFNFGAITYPHQLFRVIATEQIYRAFNILNNTPYHK